MTDRILTMDGYDLHYGSVPRRADDRLRIGIPRDLTGLPVLPGEFRDHKREQGRADGLAAGWYRNTTSTTLFYVTASGDWQRVRVSWKWKKAVANATAPERNGDGTAPAVASATSLPPAGTGRQASDAGSIRYPSRDEAVSGLTEWARVYASRDGRITAALNAGVGVNEIARITGVAKTTVIRVLKGVANATGEAAS